MSLRSPVDNTHTGDPFQLDRLAEELADRETASSARRGDDEGAHIHDLPVYVPLSHRNEHLIAKDFNVEDFLLSRSHTSLSDLRGELREYLSELKEELVKLINDDYEAFISLSTDLRDEGLRLAGLKAPLGDFRLQVLESRSELQAIQNAIQEKLTSRAVLREEKALLHLLLKLSELVTRLESLLLISPPESEDNELSKISRLRLPAHLSNEEEMTEDRSHGNKAKHLGRVATEYSQLLYHASKARAENCIFVDEIQWRIDRIQSTLSSDLDHLFVTTLNALTGGKAEGKVTEVEKTKLTSDLTECLRTYDVLGLWRDAEDVLRREVVRGFVKKTIYPGALAAPHSPIVPHTPFPPAKGPSFLSAASLPPRTPYTPFTAFVSSKQSSTRNLGSNENSPYAHLLEDADDPLARLYSQTLRFVERDLSGIMEIAERISIKSMPHSRFEIEASNLQSFSQGSASADNKKFQIMANVIWEEIGQAIMNELGGIVFSAGRPNDFRNHHEITQAFIRSLEFLAPSIHSIEVMRSHPVYSAFEQRWQLPVYFQMRWKEIIGKLEDALTVTRIEPLFTKDRNAFVTPQSTAVWVAITACWSAEVFVPELCHRFWRLTLQILSRYKTWFDQCLSMAGLTSKPLGGAAETILGSPAISRASTPVPTTETPSPETTAADDITLRQYSAAIIDIKAMRGNVLTIWREEISMMLPEMSESSNSDVGAQEALQHALTELTSLTMSMSNQIISILTKRCCEALLPVRSIPSQFRAMSSKRPPSEPSYFVSSILRPIKLFFGIGVGEGPGLLLVEDHLVPYSTEAFDSVSQRYVYYLSAMKKTEESLRRLKKGKKATFSLFGSANPTKDDDGKDEERIRKQMMHDVEAFGKDAESLGVLVERSESFQALKDMVNAIEEPS